MSEHNHIGILLSLLGILIVLAIQTRQINRMEKENAD